MYQVIVLPEAVKDISRLDKAIAKRIIDKLAWLSDNLESTTLVALKANLAGFYKLRVGDWRLIFDVDKEKRTVFVHSVKHRSEVYKT